MALKDFFQKLKQRSEQARSALRSDARLFKNLNAKEQETFNSSPIQWQAPLYLKKQKPKWWRVAASLILVGLVVYGLFTGSWQFAVAVILIAGFSYYFEHQEAPIVQIAFSHLGVRIGARVYPYKLFQTFWVDYEPPYHNEVHLVPHNRYKYELTIYLASQDHSHIQRFLQTYLPEWTNRKKTTMEHLANLTGL